MKLRLSPLSEQQGEVLINNNETLMWGPEVLSDAQAYSY